MKPPAAEESMIDYTALIEEEMARMSYGEEQPSEPPSSSVTKLRTRS